MNTYQHSAFGAVYVGLFKCVGVVFSFTVTFGVIILAFAVSIFVVLRNSRMKVAWPDSTKFRVRLARPKEINYMNLL